MATKRKTRTKAEKKARVNSFLQASKERSNIIAKQRKAEKAQMELFIDARIKAKKIYDLSVLKPEIVATIDGVTGLNEELVFVNEEGVVSWKEDNTPILPEHTDITAEFFNIVLAQIEKDKNKNHVIDDLLVENENGELVLQQGITVSPETDDNTSSATVVE
jgi:hypothetical protein